MEVAITGYQRQRYWNKNISLMLRAFNECHGIFFSPMWALDWSHRPPGKSLETHTSPKMLLFSYIKYLLEVGKIHLLEVLISPWTLQKTWHGFFPFFDGPAFKKKRSRRNGHCMFLNEVAKIISLQLQSQKLRN